MVFLYSFAKTFERLLQKIEVLSFHRLLFWGWWCNRSYFIQVHSLREAALCKFAVLLCHMGRTQGFFLSCVIHRLCSLSFASSHVVWGRQLTIYCSGTDLCQNLCFHSSGESGISAAKCSALCRHVTVSSLT